jgi:hypothetical protein
MRNCLFLLIILWKSNVYIVIYSRWVCCIMCFSCDLVVFFTVIILPQYSWYVKYINDMPYPRFWLFIFKFRIYSLFFHPMWQWTTKENVGRMNFDCLLVPDLNLFLYISVNSSSFLLEKTKIKISGTCIQFYQKAMSLDWLNST